MNHVQFALAAGLLVIGAGWAQAEPPRLDAARSFDPGERLVRTAVLTGDYAGFPPQNADPGPQFGYSVATDGDWLAVGEPGLISDQGSAFGTAAHGQVSLFKRVPGGWQLRQRIRQGAFGDSRCGFSVALSLPNLAIGCPGADELADPSTQAGVVRWYRLGGNEIWTLSGGYHGPPGSGCGTSVALTPQASGAEMAATGCPDWNTARGFVQLYRYDTNVGAWLPLATSLASNATAGDEYGAAIAVDFRDDSFGGVLLLAAGAPGRSHSSAAGSGSVLLYRWDGGWTWLGEYTGPQPQLTPQARFGSAVALNPPQLVIGAPRGLSFLCPSGLSLPRCGSVHRYARPLSSWIHQEDGTAVNVEGSPSGEQVGMAFGSAVALGGRRWIAIAAPQADGHTATIPAGVAHDVGVVELRRRDDTGHGVGIGHYRYELRPGPIIPGVQLTGGRFGTSIDFGDRRLAVGYPGAGSLLGQRRGQVWIYDEDRLFANGLEPPTVEIPPPP